MKFRKEVRDVNLWMDFSDFPMEGKKTVSKKSSDWSYKCNAPWKTLNDAQQMRGVIRKLWGGYSPKYMMEIGWNLMRNGFRKSWQEVWLLLIITLCCY